MSDEALSGRWRCAARCSATLTSIAPWRAPRISPVTFRSTSRGSPGDRSGPDRGLDRRTRSAITLAALTALGREGELALHVRGALRNGLTAHEISEILIHTSVYAGVPAANAAFAVAQRVLDEEAGGGPD